MKSPHITVLMAVYNGGEYLKQSIESILNQTFTNFEFLIINDCSTDETLAIIGSFHDPRIVIHTNDQNLGQTKSLNVGLKLANGEYVARIDADDIALPQWLEQQVLAINQNPNHVVISANAVIIDEQMKCKKFAYAPVDMDNIILRSIFRSPINHVGSLMKTQVILSYGGYDEKYKIAADYDLWLRLAQNKRLLTTTQKTLMAIRSHPESISRLGRGDDTQIKEIADIMRKAVNFFSSASFTDQEIHLLCKSFYAEGDLKEDEFDTAIAVLKRVYENPGSVFNIEESKRRKWIKYQCRVLYLKRIHFYILAKNYKVVRDVAKKGIRECGRRSVFLLLFFVSFFGRFIIQSVPGIYFRFHRGRACLGVLQKCKRDTLSPLVTQKS